MVSAVMLMERLVGLWGQSRAAWRRGFPPQSKTLPRIFLAVFEDQPAKLFGDFSGEAEVKGFVLSACAVRQNEFY